MGEPLIRIQGLEKSFEGLNVLRGVDMDVHRGETLAILGGSGTGKSVLVKHLVGLLNADAGSIRMGGNEITEYSGAKLYEHRRRFGYLFQGAALFDSLDVGENIGLGLKENSSKSAGEIAAIVSEKLALVGLAGTEHKSVADLSGGMRKRVGLARAIAMEPEVIIYDEPTTGLDPVTSAVIGELIQDMKRNLAITSIVVTHDIPLVLRVADRAVLLLEGKLIFQGTVAELKSAKDPRVRAFVEGTPPAPIQETP
jgi:phospholipid/cholesterol/gamma-HCH transport system ATP-binding protein